MESAAVMNAPAFGIEPLSVIGEKEDDASIPQLRALERGDESSESRVEMLHLGPIERS